MKEFKRVPGFEGYYDINEDGLIRSYWKRGNRGSILKDEPQVFIKPRIKSNNGTRRKQGVVTLYNGIKKQKFYPSRLVAQLFMGYDPNDKTKQIIFLDGDAMNARKDNLKIGSISERTLNYFRIKNDVSK